MEELKHSKERRHLGRREKNRQAQHAFRQRRKLADKGQRHRMQQLEKSVEEMGNILLGLSDEVLGMDDIAKQPRLIARVQNSIARALDLTKSVHITNDVESAALDETEDGQEVNGRKETGGYSTTFTYPDLTPYERRPQNTENTDTDGGGASTPIFLTDTSGPFQYVLQPELVKPVPLTGNPTVIVPPFAMQLVEMTLSQACLYLNGDVYISTKDLERAFGSSLRTRSLDQLFAYLKWFLGPGKTEEMRKMTGTDWDTINTEALRAELGLPPSTDQAARTRDTTTTLSPAEPEFLTAVAIQEWLQSLGAKDLGPDMMELRIYRHEHEHEHEHDVPPDPAISNPGHPLLRHGINSNNPGLSQIGFVLRLSRSILVTTLASMAVCLGKGPVYPRQEMQRALEKSVVLAQDL